MAIYQVTSKKQLLLNQRLSDTFDIELVDIDCTPYYIDKSHFKYCKPSYNPNEGKTLSPEHRAKISSTNKGRKFSAEHRAKLSAAKKGKKLSTEHRAKISDGNKGKTISAEQRKQISESLKKRYQSSASNQISVPSR